jgi:uncharacterized repeat protein (TIGR01451 family)
VGSTHNTDERRGTRRSRRAAFALVATAAIILTALVNTGTAAEATVPGTPGVPQASSLVYAEDFQNRPGPNPVVRLTGYTGATGVTYTADQAWLQACNGWIASAGQSLTAAAQVTDCVNQGSWNNSQRLAQAIGMYRGQTAAQAVNNYAQTAYTSAPAPGVGKVEFQTAANIPFTATNRFITFSVDVAAVNCTSSAPLLQFSLLNSAGVATNVGSQINGCASATTVTPPALGAAPASAVQVGTYTSNGALLFSGSSVGVRMINNNGAAGGNDHTIDNIRIIDVTPQLDKSFSPTTRITGQPSTLTLTVTNTSELAAKNGWSFTDALPAGLRVAGTSTTTCPAATLTAPVGGGSVAVTANLNANMVACTITVPVTSTIAGTYTNGPANITSAGLNPPAAASVTFVAAAPSLSIVKSVVSAGPANPALGQTVNYSFVVTNTGNVPLTNIAVAETTFSGQGPVPVVSCPPGAASLAVGAQITCTAGYVVKQADVDAGSITNTATATGTPPTGAPVTSPPDDAVVVIAAAPALTLVKTADAAAVSNVVVGQTVHYSFLVTNTGNVSLHGIGITEGAFTGSGTLSPIACPGTPASLPPGASVTCTANYVVTQHDVDAGAVTNTAVAVALPPTGPSATSGESSVQVTASAHPALTLSKSASPSFVIAAGQGVSYSFVVTNTGNVTLHDVGVSETVFSGTGPVPTVACPSGAASLAPAATVTCTASYTATQSDIDSRRISNTAAARATTPGGAAVTSLPASAEVPAYVVTLPLTGGTSTDLVLSLGASGVLISLIWALWHHLRARRRGRSL